MSSRLLVLLVCAIALRAAPPLTDEYCLMLNDPPLSKDGGALSLRSLDLAAQQSTLAHELIRRHIPIVSSVKLLLNAVFVRVPRGSRPDFFNLPNVRAAVKLAPMKRHLSDAVVLVGVSPGAWNNAKIGGVANAGAGVRIGVIDTGLDNQNPAFIDSTLTAPAGYPLGDATYTNSKIVVARSYVSLLSTADPQYSSPDDLSPVDRVGHGTAVAMIAAGETITGAAATISGSPAAITGVAPKAFLGNYKVFGSPGVNDYTSGAAVIQALEDAASDGMDVVTLALGDTAVAGPLDVDCTASVQPTGIPVTACDPRALAVENAVTQLGMTVVVSAGDDGPTLGTITSPGTAPSAITVGASTNAHDFVSQVLVTASRNQTQAINALFGSGPKPSAPITAPLVDVAKTGDPGTACSPLPANSLTGDIALVIRGACDFDIKANNVQGAGAVALLLYLDNPGDAIFVPTGLADTAIPTVLVSNTDGLTLKTTADANATNVTLDPTLYEVATLPNQMAAFSSRGPSIGLFSPSPSLGIKPELVAPGAGIYTATQTFDPNGDFWDASGFNVGEGTSFAVPFVAGVVALVKQANPTFTAAQLKSAVVNTAAANVSDNGAVADLNAAGAGQLSASDALNVTMTCVPSTLSFGLLNGSYPAPFPGSQSFTLTNVTGAAINVSMNVISYSSEAPASVTLATPSTFILQGGASTTVTLQLTGTSPSPGSFQGEVDISGTGPVLRVPYLYQVTDFTPAIIFPVEGDGILNPIGSTNVIGFRALDQYGNPLSNASGVAWTVDAGTGVVQSTADTSTDLYGIAGAFVTLGSQPEAEIFDGSLGSLSYQFSATAVYSPSITSIVNSGSFAAGSLVAGSFATIFGSNLAPTPGVPRTPYLPLSIATTGVSFDVPAANLSVPAAMSYVGPGQINLQVPWELQGQSSATIKVITNGLVSLTRTVNLTSNSPAFFEFNDAATGALEAVGTTVSYQLVDSANPIPRGEVMVLYANALGPVTVSQATGYVASSNPLDLAYTAASATVSIGGQDAPVSFAGLAPYLVGVYQLNVTVPSGISAGLQPMTLTINGVTSPASSIYVQ